MTLFIFLLLSALAVHAFAIIDKPHRRAHSVAFVVVLALIGAERDFALRSCRAEQSPIAHRAPTALPFDDPLVAELARKITESRLE